MTTVRSTSIKTYNDIQDEGFRDTWCEIAFNAVKNTPFMTAREYFDLIINEGTREQIFPRLTELKQKGYIIEVGKRKCTVSNRLCYVLSTLESLEVNILKKLGFVMSQPNLYTYSIEGATLFQDFRQGKRKSYFLTKSSEQLSHTKLHIHITFKDKLNFILNKKD